jgi:hypothetical protein
LDLFPHDNEILPMLENLKKRWKIKSNLQLFIIFIVFAITGSTSAWVSKPLCSWLGINAETFGFWFIPTKIILIFLLYQLLLLIVGFVFGQFNFFWNFEKRMLHSLGLGFLIPKKRIP